MNQQEDKKIENIEHEKTVDVVDFDNVDFEDDNDNDEIAIPIEEDADGYGTARTNVSTEGYHTGRGMLDGAKDKLPIDPLSAMKASTISLDSNQT